MRLPRSVPALVTTVSVVFSLSAAQSEAASIGAASCSWADVQGAVTSASAGDTVSVPAGSCTWETPLTITKRITLRGAGIGVTIVTGNVGPSAYLIDYLPSDPLSAGFFRLTGFTLDGNNNSALLRLYRDTISGPTYVRIDHNRFVAGTTAGMNPAIQVGGMIYGVFDKNTFENALHIDNYGTSPGGGAASWEKLAFTPGTGDNLYYEDNTFDICYTADSGGHGGRYAKRYNTYNLKDPKSCYGALNGFYPLFDAHGNQGSGVYATMGVEIYGNKIISAYTISPFLGQRGGKALVFFNKVISSSTVNTQIWEEYADSISLPATAVDGTPQHVNNAYYWNNRNGASGTALFNAIKTRDLNPPVLAENVDYFNHNETFNGTSGVGCGTLEARPATCQVGVGYWATMQSCSYIDDANVGKTPTVPLSGTLYSCSTPNTWTAIFTPYTYPHPFTGPAAPSGVIVR